MKRKASALASAGSSADDGRKVARTNNDLRVLQTIPTYAALLDVRASWSTVVKESVRQGDILDRGNRQLSTVVGAPVVLHTQLVASVGPNRVEQDLSQLQSRGLVRRFHAPVTGQGEPAAIFCEDLGSYLSAQIDAAGAAQQAGSSSSSAGSASTAQSSSASSRAQGPQASAPELFAASSLAISATEGRLLPALPGTGSGPGRPSGPDHMALQALHFFCWLCNHVQSPAVSDTELQTCFHAWAAAQRPRTELSYLPIKLDGPMHESTVPARCPGPPYPLPQLLPLLLSRGLLLRRLDIRGAASHVGGFYFGLPEGGKLLEYIRCGRKELVQRLSRCKYDEMSRRELCMVPLKTSPLPTDFHIRDGLGKGLLVQLDTASGPFIRLATASTARGSGATAGAASSAGSGAGAGSGVV